MNSDSDNSRSIRKHDVCLYDKLDKYDGKTGARIMYEKFLEHNVTLANVIIGGANMAILDMFHPDHHNGTMPIKYIKNTNEMNSGFIAEGYAKVSGEPGLVIVTSGPGVTNLITPLYDAMADGVPLLAISGQVSTKAAPEAFQKINATELTKLCTKWNYKLQTVDEIPSVLDHAFHLATSGRPGPVHIDIPNNIQTEIFTKITKNLPMGNDDYAPNSVGSIGFGEVKEIPALSSSQLDRIVSLINTSQRPILYVGQGANKCAEELLEFVLKTNIPVTTTLHALGVFDERNHLSLKMVGMHGHATANFMMQKADLILAFGSRFDDRTVGHLDTYAPCAREAHISGKGGFVHVDIRPTERNRVIEVTEFVHSDCKSFLTQINHLNLEYHSRTDWINTMNSFKETYPIKIPVLADDALSLHRVILEMNRQIEPYREKCVFTTGVGTHQMVAAQLITWTTPRSIITSGSLGAMGASLGFSMGAKLADPTKTVISIDGDGSFNMTHTELKTIMNLQIPVKILLLNNSSELMAEMWIKLRGHDRLVATDNENCDYNQLADAYGIHNLYCDKESDLESKMKEFLGYTGPVLLHTKVEKAYCFPIVHTGRSLDDMILEGNDV